MQLKKAKEYYELGIISEFSAVKNEKRPGYWLLSIKGKEDRTWTLKTARNEEKDYSSLDSLVNEVERIVGKNIESLPINL